MIDRRICFLRITACFMVILLHVSAENIHAFGDKWWAANFFDSFTRACVPIFFMISGATLLHKEESLKGFFLKRFIKIIPPLLFWSSFYLWWLQHNGVATGNWISAILSGPTMFHLWYFYALIGLYAITPVLRKFYQHSTRNEQLTFIALWMFVASLFPTFQSLRNDTQCGSLQAGLLQTPYHLTYFSGYIGFLLLGALIAHRKNSVVTGLAIFVVSSIGTMAATYFLSTKLNGPCEFFYIYLSPLVILAAYGLFSFFMALQPGVPSRWIAAVSDCTLGIYCLHVFMIDPLLKVRGISATVGNPWITSLSTAVAVFIGSLVMIYCVRLIKPFRHVT